MTIGFITPKGGEGKSLISRMFCTVVNYEIPELKVRLIDADVQNSQTSKRVLDMERIISGTYGDKHWIIKKFHEFLEKGGKEYLIDRCPELESEDLEENSKQLVPTIEKIEKEDPNSLIVIDVAGSMLSKNFQLAKPYLDYLFIPVSIGEESRLAFQQNLAVLNSQRHLYKRLKGINVFFNRYQKARAVQFERLREIIEDDPNGKKLGLTFLDHSIPESSILNNSNLEQSVLVNACNSIVPHTSFYDLGIDEFALEVLQRSYYKQLQNQ